VTSRAFGRAFSAKILVRHNVAVWGKASYCTRVGRNADLVALAELKFTGRRVAMTIRRFFARHAITRKKTARAAEQDRPDILKGPETWFEGQLDLDPERLIFIDETWASTKMARSHGRCRRGERPHVGVPHGHW
jgi:hypothetical protein